jgi:Signal transduction histidine kinase
MKRRGEVFRRAFLICIVLLILGNVLLVLAYTYFGKKTYIELERKSLSQSADSVQQLYARPYGQEYASSACLWYLESVSTSINTSYILILDDVDRKAYISSNNNQIVEQDERLIEICGKLLSGETVELDDYKIGGNTGAICIGRPLYAWDEQEPSGCFILIREISNINVAFSRLTRSLWLVMLLLLPLLIMTAYFAVNQMLHPITEMTKVAKQLSKGNYDVRAKDGYPGELGLLARTLNNMSSALSSTIRQLENEKRQLGYILSSFSDGVAAIDKQGMLTHYNPALMKMFGAVDVHTTLDLVPDRSVWEAFEAVVDSEEPRMFHYNLPGDRVLWISIVPVLYRYGRVHRRRRSVQGRNGH